MRVTTRRACNEPRRRDRDPGGGHASDQAIAVGQGWRRHPVPAGQIPGMTPRRGQPIQESRRAPGYQHQPCQPAPGRPLRTLTDGSVLSRAEARVLRVRGSLARMIAGFRPRRAVFLCGVVVLRGPRAPAAASGGESTAGSGIGSVPGATIESAPQGTLPAAPTASVSGAPGPAASGAGAPASVAGPSASVAGALGAVAPGPGAGASG